jgi:hypothetical protein
MSFVLNDNAKLNAPKPIDERDGPWPDISTALANVSFRYEGQTVKIGTPVVEYWFVGGTTDINLVKKTVEQSNPFISAFAGM